MDIVERLRRQSSQQDMLTCEDMLKAADEIEAARREIERLRIENWQLKGELGYPVPADIPPSTEFKCGLCEAKTNEVLATRKEIERLRVDGRVVFKNTLEQLDKADAEIERLRRSRTALLEWQGDANKEIERLRVEGRMEAKEAIRQLDKCDAEIKRLRAALRGVIEATDDDTAFEIAQRALAPMPDPSARP